MLAPFILYFLPFVIHFGRGHYDGAYYRSEDDFSSLPSPKLVFTQLSDEVTLSELTIVGTHDSATQGNLVPWVQTQCLNIDQQLFYGIRWFDLRLKNDNDDFNLHHGVVDLKIFYSYIVDSFDTFLRKNPKEFLFVSLKEEVKSDTATQSNCDLLKTLHNVSSSNFVFNWNDNYSLKEARGKIFLYNNGYFHDCVHVSKARCDVQDYYNLKTNWDLYYKWELVKKFHFDDTHVQKNRDVCYLNYLSGSSVGVYPDFVVSGHMAPYKTNTARLCTGRVSPYFYNSYPDFPRLGCFLGICSICFEGTNVLLKEEIKRNGIPNKQGLYVILTDFPGEELIDSVNSNNYLRMYLNGKSDSGGITNVPYSLNEDLMNFNTSYDFFQEVNRSSNYFLPNYIDTYLQRPE